MSELKTLLAEARASLQDLDSLLRRARSLDEVVHGQQTIRSRDSAKLPG